MLPNIRFAIGAVLASAVFIVTAFALAATVRMSQYRAAPPPLETALAYSDPAEWDRRPDALRRLEELRGDAGREVLLDRLAAPTTPITTGRADATAAAVREEAADRRSTEVALPAASVALPLPGEAISPLPARTAEEIVAPLEMPAAAPRPTEALAPQSETSARPVAPAEALSPPTAMAADAATVAPPVAPAEAATATAAVTAVEPRAAQPVVTEEAVRVASLPAPVEAAVKTSPQIAASITAPARKAVSKLRKKFAAAKKFARVRAPRAGAWIQPTARTGYPVSTIGWSRNWPRSVSKPAESK